MRKPWNKGLRTGIIPTNAWHKGEHPSIETEFKTGHLPTGGTPFKKGHKFFGYRLKEGIVFSKTREYKRLSNQAYKRRVRIGGKLSIKIIQTVYENNIKQYGTLTCYLCVKPIEFGKDHLEHKIPLSRGGSNECANLAIACQRCNCRKSNKTDAEYRKEVS